MGRGDLLGVVSVAVCHLNPALSTHFYSLHTSFCVPYVGDRLNLLGERRGEA